MASQRNDISSEYGQLLSFAHRSDSRDDGDPDPAAVDIDDGAVHECGFRAREIHGGVRNGFGVATPAGRRAALQSARVLDAQRPFLDSLDTWEAWDGWSAAVVAHCSSQASWCCPIGALASELAASDPALAAELSIYMDRWRGYLEAGIARMRDSGLLRADIDPQRLALSLFASLHGGLQLSQTTQSVAPLEAALDGALTALHAYAR
jgi:hypothetical protein